MHAPGAARPGRDGVSGADGHAGHDAPARADSLGVRGLGCMDLDFDIEVRDDQVLGPVDQGFRLAMWALQGGRVAIAAQALGIGEAALDEAIAYAKTPRGVRSADRELPGDSVDARRHGDRARRGADADAGRRRPRRIARTAGRGRGVDGEAGRVGSGAQGRRQGDADSRVGRLPPRLDRRAAVPRRPRDGDLSGHVRGAADDHRREPARDI